MKPRITDADAKPRRLIDSDDIARDVDRFLKNGGRIQRPDFRRDELEQSGMDRDPTTRRRWKKTPPDLKQFLRGVT